MEAQHTPVFKDFILSLLKKEDRIVLDATLGEGGHTQVFLEEGKKVIAFERDPQIASRAQERLQTYFDRGQLFIHHNNYRDIQIKNLENMGVDLALFDLGISKFHYLEGGRGFSFQKDEPLDMRLDENSTISARDIINGWREEELANLFYRYGEETLSRPCARYIVLVREKIPILTSKKLAEIITQVYKKKKVRPSLHPATKVFQALRIEVNQELQHIPSGVEGAMDCLRPGGRLVVIAYHSLEDRLVKKIFRSKITPKRNYNKYLPDQKSIPRLKEKEKEFSLFNKKIIRPDQREIRENPSARSACLRILLRVH